MGLAVALEDGRTACAESIEAFAAKVADGGDQVLQGSGEPIQWRHDQWGSC